MSNSPNLDICERIARMDLDSPVDQKLILSRDKHTRLEGLCVEALFERTLVANTFEEHTSGFWFTRKSGAYRVVKFLVDPLTFAELDARVLDHLTLHGMRAWVVFFDRKESTFRVLNYRKGCMSEAGIASARAYPRTTEPIPIPGDKERKADRQEKAFKFLLESGRLREAAIERLFANCWIGKNYFWDIDCLAYHDDQLVAFEVKQKYPTKAGTFGLNNGLVQLFNMLTGIKIRVVHVVLTMPTNDITAPALDLILEPAHRARAFWLAANVSPDLLSGRQGSAPAYTSIHGTDRLNFRHLSPSHFHNLGNVSNEPTLIEFLSDRTDPIDSLKYLL